jgi:hypothetical protein
MPCNCRWHLQLLNRTAHVMPCGGRTTCPSADSIPCSKETVKVTSPTTFCPTARYPNRWLQDAGEGVGRYRLTVSAPTMRSCLGECDLMHDCAAAAVSVVPGSTSDQITSCSLIKGDSNMGWWKRSVTRTDVSRLLPDSVSQGMLCCGCTQAAE